MKRQFIKKLATVTVSAAMLAALFSGGINAGIWTAQAQETNVAAASEQFDTTAPVVESISIDKQGQNVGDDDTFKITIKAYDSESGIQDVRMILNQKVMSIYWMNIHMPMADYSLMKRLTVMSVQ